MRRTVRNWPDQIKRLNESKRGVRRIKMGSAGSSQVTRVRLLKEWNGLFAKTKGDVLYIATDPDRLPSSR